MPAPALIAVGLLAALAAAAKSSGSRFMVPLPDPERSDGAPSRAEVESLIANGHTLEDLQDLFPDHVSFPDDPEVVGVIIHTRYDGPILVRELLGELEVTGV